MCATICDWVLDIVHEKLNLISCKMMLTFSEKKKRMHMAFDKWLGIVETLEQSDLLWD